MTRSRATAVPGRHTSYYRAVGAGTTVAVLVVAMLAGGRGDSDARPVAAAERSGAPPAPTTAGATAAGAVGEREGLVVVAGQGTVEARAAAADPRALESSQRLRRNPGVPPWIDLP